MSIRGRLVLSGLVLLGVAGAWPLSPARAQRTDVVYQRLIHEGDSLLAIDSVQAAERHYRQALARNDRKSAAYEGLGRVSLARQRWSEAADRLAEALEREPNRLGAHYHRGIALRELAKVRTILQARHWGGAERHFEQVLAADSLFQDVLFQYALLDRYHGDYEDALRLGHTQVRLRPYLDAAQAGLFDLYRFFIRHARRGRVQAWQAAHPSAWAAWATGERLRQEGALDAAADTLRRVLARPFPSSRAPVLLSLARVEYARNRPREAEALVMQAIDGIDSPLDAALVFEDVKYIVTPAEYGAYRRLRTPPQFRAFFRRFWAERDPMPARPFNARLQEHYRRLRIAEKDYAWDGFRLWYNSPDKARVLDYPLAYELNHEFNDKGLILLRHGEPADRVFTVGPDVLDNESWRYRNPEMDFHFLIDRDATGNNWRLAPSLPDPAMWYAREIWGGIYHDLVRADSDVEVLEATARMTEQNRRTVEKALATDRQTWDAAVEPVALPHLASAFRDSTGGACVELAFRPPVEQVFARLPEGAAARVEVGFALQDTTFSVVAETTVVRTIERTAAPVLDAVCLPAPPGAYRATVHTTAPGTGLLGGHQFALDVPAFDGPSMSDVVPARLVEPATGAGRFVRHGYRVVPHLAETWRRDEPLHLYFEVYDLSTDADGNAQFALEYRLTPEEGRRAIFGLIGPRIARPALSLHTERTSPTASPVETAEIDVSRVAPGRYVLTVLVTDRQTGRHLERSRTVELVR